LYLCVSYNSDDKYMLIQLKVYY